MSNSSVGLRGFSNTFMPESKVEAMDLQYIEGSELERAWKTTRRQHLKEQEQRIWEEFVKEQDILKACTEDPYQFLEHLPESYLKELMDSELQKIRQEKAEEEARATAALELQRREQLQLQQNTVTFTEAAEDSDVFHIFEDDRNDDVSSPEDEGLNESIGSPCTVRGADAAGEAGAGEAGAAGGAAQAGAGAAAGGESSERSIDKGSSKSSENVSNMMETSVYSAKVKELRVKLNEELQAIIATLEQRHVVSLEQRELRDMWRRAAEFGRRFQRVHVYRLQRQVRDIQRRGASDERLVSLHRNMLHSFQALHKSFEHTSCLRESAAQLAALLAALRRAPAPPAPRLPCDELMITCDKVEAAVKEYSEKVADYIRFMEPGNETQTKKTPKNKEKKKSMGTLSKNTSRADARLSMYSLATMRLGVPGKPSNNLAIGLPKPRAGGTSASRANEVIDAPKSHRKSPRCRRPLMREGGGARAPRARDRDPRTMVEAVDAPSSQISLEASPNTELRMRTPRRRTTPHTSQPTPHTSHRTPNTSQPTPHTSHLSPHVTPSPRKTRPKLSTGTNRSDPHTVLEGLSPASKIRCEKRSLKKDVEAEKLDAKDENEKTGGNTPKDGNINGRDENVRETNDTKAGSGVKSDSEKLDVSQPASPKVTSGRRSEKEKRMVEPAGLEVTRLLRQLCGGDANGNERAAGAKNAQLFCVNGGSPRQPSTPQLLKILEETIQKKVPKSMQRKSKPKDVDKLRLNFNIPDHTAENLFQYRTKFVQHMLTSSMYANCAVGKPWEMIISVSEQIIDELLLKCSKEMEIRSVVQDLYKSETT